MIAMTVLVVPNGRHLWRMQCCQLRESFSSFVDSRSRRLVCPYFAHGKTRFAHVDRPARLRGPTLEPPYRRHV